MSLISAAVLTIAIETVILIAVGYHTRVFIIVCALINLATNLSLNLGLSLAGRRWYFCVLYPAEVLIVVIEWAVLRLVIDEDSVFSHASMKLMAWVFVANLTTLCLGLLLGSGS